MKTKLLTTLLFLSIGLNAQYNFEEIDINPNGSSLPHSFVEFNGALYFSAINNNSGRELWKTDGTQAGTVLVKDINPNGDADPRRLTVLNNTLFFTAKNGTNGRELWKTDGTEQGTVIVKDILTGVGDGLVSAYRPFYIYNNKLVFVGFLMNPNGGSFLFESDGTAAGTKAISRDVKVDFDINTERGLATLGTSLYFNGNSNGGTNTGEELWKFDGTNSTIVKDINSNSGSSNPSYMTVFKNHIYFSADNGTTGAELWKTDGTDIGTVMVKDIRTGGASSLNQANDFQVYKNKLFFGAFTDANGFEIWESDGTEEGTKLFIDTCPTSNGNSIHSGIHNNSGIEQIFYVIDNKMYFSATSSYDVSNNPNNIEPWVSDGTVAGTKQLADINPTGSSVSRLSFYHQYNNKIFFNTYDSRAWANDPNNFESSLWVFDPNTNDFPVKIEPTNTTFTKLLSHTSNDSFNIVNFNNSLYLSVRYDINDDKKGSELWKITDDVLNIESFKTNSISLYPNPTTSIFTISSSKNAIQTIEIYNLLGKKVWSKNVKNQFKVNVNSANLSKGIYMIKVNSDDKIISKKLIIN